MPAGAAAVAAAVDSLGGWLAGRLAARLAKPPSAALLQQLREREVADRLLASAAQGVGQARGQLVLAGHRLRLGHHVKEEGLSSRTRRLQAHSGMRGL